ncbi:MAG: MFS transporter [Rhodocyclaceae bacterium]|nr:MFS transporter [Rhodocyclaceae bacterium]
MISHIVPISALLAGVALLLLGNGLLGTLLAVRGGIEGYSAPVLGLMGSGYFAGFLVGTALAPPLIRRIGHIRAFAFFAAATAATALLHGLLVSPVAWVALRVLGGTSLVSLYMIIESWLNSQAGREQRGRVFALYMVVNLGALAIAQQLLRLDSPADFTLFAVAALFICLATMPVAATRLAQPATTEPGRFSPKKLWREAPVAASGGLLSGLTMGAFWTMGPVYAARIGLPGDGVALFMSACIVGGALLQWPLGAFSDSRDRRSALAITAFAAALAALPLVAGESLGRWSVAAIALYGGLAFAIYPMSVAHLVDHLRAEDIVGGSSVLLLVHGIGAAIGPMLAGGLMALLGAKALAVHFAVAQVLLATIAWLATRRGAEQISEPAHFVPMVRTTPTVLEIMPTPDDFPPPSHAGEAASAEGANELAAEGQASAMPVLVDTRPAPPPSDGPDDGTPAATDCVGEAPAAGQADGGNPTAGPSRRNE